MTDNKRRRLRLVVSAALVNLATALPTAPAAGPRDPALEKLAAQLASNDWPAVLAAKEALESREARAIPVLLALLRRDEYVKLRNTADLIYPGATEFFGHGLIVAYDIDWLSVRAGWALEELTFQSFGFREGALRHDDFLEAAMAGKADAPLSQVVTLEADAAAKRERRSRSIAAATAWWGRSSKGWNRLAAVVEALQSGVPARQVAALNWLRHGETPCRGLSKETFTKRILPEVRRLAGSADHGVKEQAVYLLADFESNEWYWLSRKKPPE